MCARTHIYVPDSSPHLREPAALGQVVNHLGGVRDGLHPFTHCLEALGDEVGGALVSETKHHGRTDIKRVPLALEMTGASAWDEVPA